MMKYCAIPLISGDRKSMTRPLAHDCNAKLTSSASNLAGARQANSLTRLASGGARWQAKH